MGPKQRVVAEAALIIKKISPRFPLYLSSIFAFEKAFKYVSAEFAPIVQSRIFKKSLPQLSGPFSFSPHPPYLGLPTPSDVLLSFLSFFGGARSSLQHVESCCLTGD